MPPRPPLLIWRGARHKVPPLPSLAAAGPTYGLYRSRRAFREPPPPRAQALAGHHCIAVSADLRLPPTNAYAASVVGGVACHSYRFMPAAVWRFGFLTLAVVAHVARDDAIFCRADAAQPPFSSFGLRFDAQPPQLPPPGLLRLREMPALRLRGFRASMFLVNKNGD